MNPPLKEGFVGLRCYILTLRHLHATDKLLLKSSVPDAMHRTEPRREIVSGAGWRISAQFDEHHIVIHASSFASLPLLTAAMEERYCCKVLELPAMWGDCRREVVDGTGLSAS